MDVAAHRREHEKSHVILATSNIGCFFPGENTVITTMAAVVNYLVLLDALVVLSVAHGMEPLHHSANIPLVHVPASPFCLPQRT